ncbi:TPA: AraC family transcriptional regulator ligand-binding domain-containing protein [Pseudomonas putida]|nr:AraC family transcriptional regulator ligand-binding domain-containing protein [Pseudomonas putida]
MGPISIVMREAQSARHALENLYRYMRLVNASLLTRIKDYGDTVLIREEILATDKRPVRQSIEIAVSVLYRMLKRTPGTCLAATQRELRASSTTRYHLPQGIFWHPGGVQRKLQWHCLHRKGYGRPPISQ